MSEVPVTAYVLRERLADLVDGQLSLDEFDDWFAVNTWDDSNVSLDARQLASRVELVLAEFTSGHWSWDEARLELTGLAQRMQAVWGDAAVTTTGVNVAEVIRVAVPVHPFGEASIQYVEACV